MAQKFITVNFKQLLKDRLFAPLRTVFNESWHNYLQGPLDNLYAQILSIRANNLFLTNHTSQKISLDHLFNTLTDVNGFKLIVGSPVSCLTSETTPLSFFFTNNERDTGLVPDGVVGAYTYNGSPVTYSPVLPVAYTDDEIYDINNAIKLANEEITWMFTDTDAITSGYTIFVDPVDYVGYLGLDVDGNAIYAPGSKLDIINKYAAQYTAVGILYKIQSR